jgi:hypothetical protein
VGRHELDGTSIYGYLSVSHTCSRRQEAVGFILPSPAYAGVTGNGFAYHQPGVDPHEVFLAEPIGIK